MRSDAAVSCHYNITTVRHSSFSVLKTKLVRAKIDQANEIVHVSSTMHRTFTTQHWKKLHTLLTSWKSNLHVIREQIGHLASAQIELIHQNQKQVN